MLRSCESGTYCQVTLTHSVSTQAVSKHHFVLDLIMLVLISAKPQNEAKHLPLRSQSERLLTVSYHTARDFDSVLEEMNFSAGAVSHQAPAIKKDKRAFLNKHDAVLLITQQFFKYESVQFQVLDSFSCDNIFLCVLAVIYWLQLLVVVVVLFIATTIFTLSCGLRLDLFCYSLSKLANQLHAI